MFYLLFKKSLSLRSSAVAKKLFLGVFNPYSQINQITLFVVVENLSFEGPID